MTTPSLAPDLFLELHQLHPSRWLRAAQFVFIYAAAVAVILLLQSSIGTWAWLACLPFYLLAGASLQGISLFTHEGVHGVVHANPLWNRMISALCASPVLQNFSAYRVLHLRHHAHLGQKGDLDHYPNYARWTWLEFAMYWGRLLVGYPAYVVAIPVLGFRHGQRADRCWIPAELLFLALLCLFVLALSIPPMALVHGWLIPMVFINTPSIFAA